MRRKLTGALLTLLALTVLGPGTAASQVSELSELSEQDGSGRLLRLFDGRGLTGWSQAGPGGFDVVDGVLRSRDGMGLLWYSARQFADYELRLQWRVSAPTDNSGVFLRFPDPGDDPWVAVNQGYEVQINDNPAGDPQKTGAIYNFQQPRTQASRPVGEWNDYRVRVIGQRYRVWLNGVLVNDFTSTDPARGDRGHLGLQNHDPTTRAEFRHITVRELHRR